MSAVKDKHTDWAIHAEGPAATLPLTAFSGALKEAAGILSDFRLRRFGSLAALSITLSLQQGKDEALRSKLHALQKLANWQIFLSPFVGGCTCSKQSRHSRDSSGSRDSSRDSSGWYCSLKNPDNFCLSVLLPGPLLPASLFAAICEVLERHSCWFLGTATERTAPFVYRGRQRRLLLTVSFCVPFSVPSLWPHLGNLLKDLRFLLSETHGAFWSLRRRRFQWQPKLKTLVLLHLRNQPTSDAPAATATAATADAQEDVRKGAAAAFPGLASHVASPETADERQGGRPQGNILLSLAFLLHCLQRQGYRVSLCGGNKKEMECEVCSLTTGKEPAKPKYVAVISMELPAIACDFYGVPPTLGEEDAVLPLLGLHSWHVRLFAASCPFYPPRKSCSSSSDSNDSGGSSSDSSGSSGDESECTRTSWQTTSEAIVSLPLSMTCCCSCSISSSNNGSSSNSGRSSSSMQDLRNPLHALFRCLGGCFFKGLEIERSPSRFLAVFCCKVRQGLSPSRPQAFQLNAAEVEGLEKHLVFEGLPLRLLRPPTNQIQAAAAAPDPAAVIDDDEWRRQTEKVREASRAEEQGSSNSNDSNSNSNNSSNNKSSSRRTYELLLLQQPQLTTEFLVAAAARVEAFGGTFDEGERISPSGEFIAVRFFLLLPRGANVALLKGSLQQVAASNGGDLMLRRRSIAGLCLQLVCFDMDSTLIREEVIDELAAQFGKGEEVAAITRDAMGGSLSFEESLKARLSLLEGLERCAVTQVSHQLHLNEGALPLCLLLKRRGVFLAILSGGFSVFADEIKEKLQVDFARANRLVFQQGEKSSSHKACLLLSPHKHVITVKNSS